MDQEEKAIKRSMLRKIKLGKDRLTIDLSKEYGLVLEGGGARGAFQIGACRALLEAGLKIKGISGVSVGALNGALICMGDLERAESIWENIEYSAIIEMEESFTGAIKKLLQDRGLDIAPLKRLIREAVDEDKIRSSDCELFATTYSLTDKKLLTIDVKQLPEGEISDILMASSYLPVFKTEKLGGKLYTDGGGFNNVPLDVLVDRDYKDIIVLRIYGIGLDREWMVKIPEGTNVYHVAPLEDLGGILEFDKKRSRKNMVLGYLEAQRFIYGLSGRRYYIDAPEGEGYYFNKMMSEPRLLEMYFILGQKMADQEITGSYRYYTEFLFPAMALRFRLKAGWNYKDLYLMLLEDLALKLKLFRYRIYTAGELAREVYKHLLSIDFKLSVTDSETETEQPD